MGMAASQARLLSLTARMHDIEYKAQKLQAQKLQMANKSQAVYQEYEAALNKTKVQYKVIGADGSAAFRDATIKNLVTDTGEAKSDYIIHNIAENKMYCTAKQIESFVKATDANLYKKNAAGDYVDKDGNALADQTKYKEQGVYQPVEAAKAFAIAMGDPSGESQSFQMLYNEMLACADAHGGDPKQAFTAVNVASTATTAPGLAAGAFDESQYKPGTELEKQFSNKEYLTNMINEGFIVLHKLTGDNITGAAEEVNVAVDASLQEVSDEVDLKKAEAKYEADMRKINTKDKKFDTDIAALEQERNAIKTEMDTLKTVAKDNVERTFKLFS